MKYKILMLFLFAGFFIYPSLGSADLLIQCPDFVICPTTNYQDCKLDTNEAHWYVINGNLNKPGIFYLTDVDVGVIYNSSSGTCSYGKRGDAFNNVMVTSNERIYPTLGTDQSWYEWATGQWVCGGRGPNSYIPARYCEFTTHTLPRIGANN